MTTGDLIPTVLLLLFAAAIGAGVAMLVFIRMLRRREVSPDEAITGPDEFGPEVFFAVSPLRAFWRRPACWLAIRSRNLAAVQAALRLGDAKPCSWSEGLSRERQLFIAPPLSGWIMVMGAGLPDPGDDVDECFRFLMELSKRVGHVQLFKADPVTHHHGWARVEAGRVVRAYAWAGRTIWNQGAKTNAERELGLKCLGYGEGSPSPVWGESELMALNAEKVPLLAARWSLNPAAIDARFVERSRGISGWPAKWF
ncbi:MAG: hypothetical protein EXS35_12425 [Pedosphaera sp.]|nr:hypothetical protein [Pedosphaera sp.]